MTRDDHIDKPCYSMLIQWNGEAFTATFPEFPGHAAQGTSWEDAARNGSVLLGQILESGEQPGELQSEFGEKLAQGSDTCSFCDRQPGQIERLTRGPGGVNICNACVDVCREVIEQEGNFDDMRKEITTRRNKEIDHIHKELEQLLSTITQCFWHCLRSLASLYAQKSRLTVLRRL
jgi:predicted RNase H-like HicB family nuclease